MTDEQIREQIRVRLRTGAIPSSMPLASASEGTETIIVNGGLGRPCAACDEVITPSPNPSLLLIYGSREIAVHGRCHVLWVLVRSER